MHTQLAIVPVVSVALLSSSVADPAPKDASPSNPAGGKWPPLVLPRTPPLDKDFEAKSRILYVSKNQSLVAAAFAEYPKAVTGHEAPASSALPFPVNLTPLSLSVGEGKKTSARPQPHCRLRGRAN